MYLSKCILQYKPFVLPQESITVKFRHSFKITFLADWNDLQCISTCFQTQQGTFKGFEILCVTWWRRTVLTERGELHSIVSACGWSVLHLKLAKLCGTLVWLISQCDTVLTANIDTNDVIHKFSRFCQKVQCMASKLIYHKNNDQLKVLHGQWY